VTDGVGAQATLEAEHRAIALFTRAMAGRALQIEAVGLAPTALHLPAPALDPDTIRLPAAVAGFASRHEARGALRIAVLREVLRRIESVRPDGTSVPSRPGPAAGRGHGNGDDPARPAGLPADPRPVLLRRIHGMLERARLDATIRMRCPGAAPDLDRVLAAALARRGPIREAARPRDLLDAFARGLAHTGPTASAMPPRQALGPLEPIDPTGRLARMLEAAGVATRAEATSADTLQAARRVVALLAGGIASARLTQVPSYVVGPGNVAGGEPEGAGAVRPDAGADSSDDADPTQPPAVPFAGIVPDAAGAGRIAGAALAAAVRVDGPDPAADTRWPPSRRATAVRRPRPMQAAGVLHDEWDYLAGRYLRDWCRVHEHRLHGSAGDFGVDVHRRHPGLAARIRERFARLRPRGRTRVRGVDDGDELDLDSVIASLVDRRAGHGSDERVYVRRDPMRRDVAAAFLVDMSASTAAVLPEPAAMPDLPPRPFQDTGALLYGVYDDELEPPREGPRRRMIDVAKDALALMSGALETLGDAHAVWGFSGDGRARVEFAVAKAFDEPVSSASWAAIAAIEPRGSSRMGAAIRHATHKLSQRTEARRLLVVVSDGYPQDGDYGPDRLDVEYGVQDTARALRDAERAGVATFCVTIDPAGHDYLGRMCPARRYRVIEDVPELPEALAAVYADLAQ
jgi:hypothetical protein